MPPAPPRGLQLSSEAAGQRWPRPRLQPVLRALVLQLLPPTTAPAPAQGRPLCPRCSKHHFLTWQYPKSGRRGVKEIRVGREKKPSQLDSSFCLIGPDGVTWPPLTTREAGKVPAIFCLCVERWALPALQKGYGNHLVTMRKHPHHALRVVKWSKEPETSMILLTHWINPGTTDFLLCVIIINPLGSNGPIREENIGKYFNNLDNCDISYTEHK